MKEKGQSKRSQYQAEKPWGKINREMTFVWLLHEKKIMSD